MKRYIKELICLALQLIMFYLFPLFAGPTDAIGMVVIILVTTWLFAMIVGMLSKNKIKYLYPIIVAILFIPSVFIHYNSSALIHAIWYLVDAFAGLLWGMLVNYLSRLLNKKATSKTINNAFVNATSQFNAKTGMIRLVPLLNELDCVEHGTLTEEEKEIVHALLYKNFSNRTTINELKYISDNAKIVGAGEIPQVPMLLFISNDTSTTELTDATQRYANTVENAKVIQLDCPHYVHDYEYNMIGEEIKNFLQATTEATE